MQSAIKFFILSYCLVLFVGSVLLPPISIPSIDNFFLPFALLALLLNYKNQRVFWITGVMTGILIAVYFLSNQLHGGITRAEIESSLRWIKLFAAGWSAYYAIQEYGQRVNIVVQSTFILMVVINALQLLDVSSVVDLYSIKSELQELHNESLIDSRLFGTFLNANTNGLMFSIFALYFLLSKIEWKYIYTGIAIVMLLMTQSRTAFLAFMLVMVAVVVIRLARRNPKLIFVFVGGLALSIVLLFQFKLSNLNSLFDGTAYGSNSVTTRFEVIEKVFEVNQSSMLLGQGKINNVPEFIGASIDNEYAYIYLEYGLIGLLSFVLLFVLLTRISINQKPNALALGILAVMLCVGFTNLSFSNLEVSPAFFCLFGIAIAQSKIEKVKEEKRA